MKYYKNDSLIIRSMTRSDIEKIIDGFAEQNWQKPKELFESYYTRQENKEHIVIVAEINNQVAGYVTLLPSPPTGPYASENISEIVDLNVFIKFKNIGIGNISEGTHYLKN